MLNGGGGEQRWFLLEGIAIEPTRVYSIEDERQFLAG
jgi:hypothetical protein